MTTILTLTPGTFLQSSFDKVGYGRRYEEIELKTTGAKATFTAETPIQLHPGTTISGDEKAIIKLIPYASTCLWKPQVSVFSFLAKIICLKGSRLMGWLISRVCFMGKVT
ncbi:MAG: hypothetical protein LLG05_10310, partial [Porphyromonadaceae bacterium]|nr:hypothetical protein [Porphyromonadaceae bacterium]